MPALSLMIKPVSGACNMRCRYCFYADIMDHREQRIYPKMTLETLEVVVRRTFRYADGPVSFSFQGGEPTLAGLEYFEMFARLVRQYNARGLPVAFSIQSNGYDLSDAWIRFLKEQDFLVGISLDGSRKTHDLLRVDANGEGTFDRIHSTLERLRLAGVRYNILCVVNEHVARDPKGVFAALSQHRYLQFIPCLDPLDGSSQDYSLSEERYLTFLKETFDLYYRSFLDGVPVSIRNFDNYLDILLGMPPENCAMGGRCGQYFVIEADGSVYPCDFYVLDEFRMGNIVDLPLNRIAKTEIGTRFTEASLVIPERCRQCKWYGLCRNGCKRERLAPTQINKWCACFKAFFEYSYPRLQSLAARLSQNELSIQ